jgi:hypothetical protein
VAEVPRPPKRRRQETEVAGSSAAKDRRRDLDDERRRPRPRDEDGDEEQSAKPPMKAGSKKGLVRSLLPGGGVLLLCCCSGSIGGIVFYFYPENHPRVTSENLEHLKVGMTLKEVEDILGPGKKVTQSDVAYTYKANIGKQKEQDLQAWEGPITQNRAFRWKDGNNVIFVVLDKAGDQGGKVHYMDLIFYSSGDVYSRKELGKLQ